MRNLSEDQKELIHAIKKLTNSIDKLNILFEYVRKELVDDYDKQNNSEALLKKLVQQNKIIAQGMVKLADKHDDQNSGGEQEYDRGMQQSPNSGMQGPSNQQNYQNQQRSGQDNQQPPQAPPQQNQEQPQMDFTNFKGVNDTPMPEPRTSEKKGFMGMFKK